MKTKLHKSGVGLGIAAMVLIIIGFLIFLFIPDIEKAQNGFSFIWADDKGVLRQYGVYQYGLGVPGAFVILFDSIKNGLFCFVKKLDNTTTSIINVPAIIIDVVIVVTLIFWIILFIDAIIKRKGNKVFWLIFSPIFCFFALLTICTFVGNYSFIIKWENSYAWTYLINSLLLNNGYDGHPAVTMVTKILSIASLATLGIGFLLFFISNIVHIADCSKAGQEEEEIEDEFAYAPARAVKQQEALEAKQASSRPAVQPVRQVAASSAVPRQSAQPAAQPVARAVPKAPAKSAAPVSRAVPKAPAKSAAPVSRAVPKAPAKSVAKSSSTGAVPNTRPVAKKAVPNTKPVAKSTVKSSKK